MAKNVTLEGADYLEQKLRGLSGSVAISIIDEALARGIEPMYDDARSLQVVASGRARASYRLQKVYGYDGGRVRVAELRSDAKSFRGHEFYLSFWEFGFYRGKRQTRQKLVLRGPNEQHRRRKHKLVANVRFGEKRKWVPPRPVLRRAFSQNVRNSLEIIKKSIAAGLERELAK